MSLVSIEFAAEHLRLDSDDDSDLVQRLIDVAEDAIATYLNRPLSPWSATQTLPPLAVRHAILMYVTDLYESRGAQVEKQLYMNVTTERLLYPHRTGLGI